MFEIRQLTLSDFKEIYRNYVKNDFPLMEMRPWFAVERAFRRGTYSAYGYYEEEKLLAYAAFYLFEGQHYVLLDYFAVLPDLRGSGIGSSFLRDLLGAIPEVDGIFGEAERVEGTEEEAEKVTRQRRLAFYQNNGAVLTGIGCVLFGVDYEILYFPGELKEGPPEELFDTVCSLYQELYHPVYGRLCKPYIEEKTY